MRYGASCRRAPFVSVSGHHLGTLRWVALRKPPTTRIQTEGFYAKGCLRPSSRAIGGDSNDPRHGTPCACADGGSCHGVDAGHVPWPRQQSVAGQGNKGAAGQGNKGAAGQGNKGATARAALAAPTEEDAKTFTDPRAHFQGGG